MNNYQWISQSAKVAKNHALTISRFFAKAVSLVTFDEQEDQQIKRAWTILTRDLVTLGLNDSSSYPKDLTQTIEALKTFAIDQINKETLDEKKIQLVFHEVFNNIFSVMSEHPEIFSLLENADIIGDILESVANRFLPVMKLFPVFSTEALSTLPYLKEPLFKALYELDEKEFHSLVTLTDYILRQIYEHQVRPQLKALLYQNNTGKNLLMPIIDEAIKHLPPDKCLTALLIIMCTPKTELTQGRIISIVLQELGGMYVKLAQVLAELAPPALAKELRHQQDKLGGLFGSQQKSWNYVLQILSRPQWERLRNYLEVPTIPQKSFAGASVGAIYEFKLSTYGKKMLATDHNVLIKIQRPGLVDLFESQKNSLILILDNLESQYLQINLAQEELQELKGLLVALKRTIINYASQSMTELDFRIEKRNADEVRLALKDQFNLTIPIYYFVEKDVSLMEKIQGEKITSVVHSRYLERVSISDLVADAYLYLMFQKGIIWADPHAGNILYDPDQLKVKLIDLNPCFYWDKKTIKLFISFLYRLILSDQKGVLTSLEGLVLNKESLSEERTKKLIHQFLEQGNQGAFIKYLSEFIRLLGEVNVELTIEVQAALRGITQIYLTAGAISFRNNFGKIFQKQFGWKMLIRHILSIGPLKVARAILPIAFDLVKNSPEQEVGPTLDERDLSAIEAALTILNQENVCNIELIRISPEENPRLTLATDGSTLIKSAHLRIEILTETKPASVKYILELPSKEWLKERQEYVRLQGLGFALCLVECLEQLRRHSLEDYWFVAETWNKGESLRSYKESSLIGDVRLAARALFSRRYSYIWASNFMTISRWNRLLWRLLILTEERFEKRETGYFYLLSKKLGSEKVGQITFGTLHRLKIIAYRLIISGIKKLIQRSRFEMNLLPLTTEELIHRMIHGLLRRSLNTLSSQEKN